MIRRFIERLTGYWVHKRSTLPIGADLQVDLTKAGIDPKTIFDVGANIGQSYIRFRRDFPDARIICFEPVSSVCEKLRLVASEVECLALGGTAGTAMVGVSDEWSVLNSLVVRNYAPDVREESINISTVDAYCSAKHIAQIDLLKIDTEGYELEVIRGATNTNVQAYFCEVGFSRDNDRNTYVGDVIDALPSFYLYGLYDVVHYERASFANALFLRR